MSWKEASYRESHNPHGVLPLWSCVIPIYPNSPFPNTINEYGQKLKVKHIFFGKTHSNDTISCPEFLVQVCSRHKSSYFWHTAFIARNYCIELSFVTTTALIFYHHDLVNFERYYLPDIIYMSLKIKCECINVWQRHLSHNNFTLTWSRPQSSLLNIWKVFP